MQRNRFGELDFNGINYQKTNIIYKGREHKYSIRLEDGTELIMFPITNGRRGLIEDDNGNMNIHEYIYDPDMDNEKAIDLFLVDETGNITINEMYYKKYKKIINVLVIMELAKQIDIPTAFYDIANIEGRHELLSLNFLKPDEKLLTFDQLSQEQKNDIIGFMLACGLYEKTIMELDELFDKMKLFSYFVGDIDYVPANYGLILNTNGQIKRIAPLFDKMDAMSKQKLPPSKQLLNKIGVEGLKKFLEELTNKSNIESVYFKLKSKGIIIPDDLITEQIDVFNYNFEKLVMQLNIQSMSNKNPTL